MLHHMLLLRGLISFLAFGLLVVAGCKRQHEPSSSTLHVKKQNVLLITVDTTRADRVGCYGHTAAKTPTMDRLAVEGVRFANAYTVAPQTLPSHASLLTGRVPQATGLRINSVGPGGGMLPQNLATLATTLKGHGYHTSAFVSAMVLAKHFGLNNGFDSYDDHIASHDGEDMTDALHLERSATKTCDAALAWLSQPRDGAYFLWVHFFDPHLPFEPPPPFDKDLSDPYDGEIAFMDSQIARLIDHVDQRGQRKNTLVVLVGDHGESLGEHGEKDHRLFIYNATLRVPMIWSFGERIPRGRVVQAPVSLVDIFPTVLELLDIAIPPGVNGRSVRGSWESDAWEAVPVYGESEYARWGFGWAPLYALVAQRWKYIEAPRPELYDLAADPHEINNVLAEHPEVGRNMSATLRAQMESFERREAHPVSDADTATRQLSGLGYVGTSPRGTLPVLQEGARDPKDMLPVYQQLMDARTRLEGRNFTGAAAILEPLLARTEIEIGLSESAYDDALTNLADAYFRLGQFEKAIALYRRSQRTAPDDPARLTAIAMSLDRLGQTPAAIEALRQALAASPDWVAAHRELAALYARERNFAAALPHWTRVVELAPKSVPALTNLGSTLLALGKPLESLGPLLRALQLDPTNEFIYRSLWQALAATGKRAEAIALLRDAHLRFPDKPTFVCPLARLLAVTPGLSVADRNEGLRLARRCAESDPKTPQMLDTLSIALAAVGSFDEAIGIALKALELARMQNDAAQQRLIESHVQRYRTGGTVVE